MSPVRKGAVLVTGGAGYVGSFAVRALVRRGVEVVVLDDLSKGHRKAVPPVVPLVRAQVQDGAEVRRVLRSRRFDAILHFAADAYVGESVKEPAKYWRNNVGGTIALLDAAVECGVPGFVLSSSCAVYGIPERKRIPETAPRRPVNPYGRTKSACEEMLEDLGAAGAIRSFRLRYFNAAGGAEDGSLGEHHDPETHLIPLAIRAAAEDGTLRILGTDYPTKDGTCVRDFVHVADLADAHAAAVMRLREGHPGGAYNLGTGKGASVLQVVRAVQKVTGKRIRTEPGPRRPGDPPVLVAAPGQARHVLGFEPQYRRLEDLVATAWAWHRRRPHGFPPNRTPEEE